MEEIWNSVFSDCVWWNFKGVREHQPFFLGVWCLGTNKVHLLHSQDCMGSVTVTNHVHSSKNIMWNRSMNAPFFNSYIARSSLFLWWLYDRISVLWVSCQRRWNLINGNLLQELSHEQKPWLPEAYGGFCYPVRDYDYISRYKDPYESTSLMGCHSGLLNQALLSGSSDTIGFPTSKEHLNKHVFLPCK